MTTAEQNAFILGVVSKGVVRVIEKSPSDNEITATEMWYLLNQDFEEVSL